MKNRIWIIALLFWVVPLWSAGQSWAGTDAGETIEQTTHRGTGKVVSVDRAKLRIKLAHDPIKSLGWSRMMMDFSVTNASLLDGLKAGDAVQFELGKTRPDELVWVIVKIERR